MEHHSWAKDGPQAPASGAARNLLMVAWSSGHNLGLSRKVGRMDRFERRTGEKVHCLCEPAGGRSGALTTAKSGPKALTLLH